LISETFGVPQLPIVGLSPPCRMNISAKIEGDDIVVELRGRESRCGRECAIDSAILPLVHVCAS